MTEPRSSASVSKPNATMGLHILQLIRRSFLDKNYQADTCWKVTDIKMIDAPQLEHSFQRRKLEMEQERIPTELKEEYLFTCYKSDEHISVIAGQGLYVQQSKFNFLGDSLLGVILCKHADIQLKAAQNEHQPKCWLMVFKVVCGRKLGVQPAGNVIRRPTDGADCHVSSVPPLLGETLGCQAIKSQVYLYEADRTSITGYSLRPRQCVPQAYVEFISCSAPAISIPPAVHMPYSGIIPHQRVSSPSIHHASASDLVYHNQRILRNSAPVGRDIRLTIPAVSMAQKFPPYVPKSSSLQNRMRLVPVVSQPPNAPPTSSSATKYSLVNCQQLVTGLFAGAGSNNTNCIESNANTVNPGHHVWQQLARPCIGVMSSNPSRMEDQRLQVLLLNQTLVIELLQAFAKEMNSVAGVWKESGCNADTTVSLRNAILALQELRSLFMQIAPVCQQFYRFAQDLFSGKTDSFPSLTVVQHQLKCLRTCQSTMSTAFKYFNEVAAKTTVMYQKSLVLAQAVLSRKALLLNCLTSLKDTLMAFNCFHTNLSGAVAGEHVKQSSNTPDLAVKNAAGRLPSSHQHSLPRQPDMPATATEANAFSPALASLLAMSGQEMSQPTSASRQESVNSTCIRNNQACERQQRDDSSSNYDVRRVSAERAMHCERRDAESDACLAENSRFQISRSGTERAMSCEREEDGQSDVCLAENSGFQFGMRLPIVIAPDDGLVDEVVDMTPIKQERTTTSRDKRWITETIFIDADEIIPECIRTKSEDVRGESSAVALSSEAFGLVLDILDEQNPGTSLAKVFCVSPDGMDESGLDNVQPYDLSLSRITKEQQSPAESATAVQDCSLDETCLISDIVDFAPSVKSDSFLESSQSDEAGSETENVEPGFVVNIEPTTEEPSDSEPALSPNFYANSPAENINSKIIADSEGVPGLSSDVCDTLVTCTESGSIQLEKSSAIGTVEVASVVKISKLKQKKCLRKKPMSSVKHKKLFFIRKFRNWTWRLYGRKKPTTLKRTLTIKPRSVNRKCRTSRTLLKKSNCKQMIEGKTTDIGDETAKVSNAEGLQISEQAEVVMPGPKETDGTMAENLSVVDFPVAESQSQDFSSQDSSANASISGDAYSTATAHTEVSENCMDSSLTSSNDSNVAKTGDNTSESSFLITSVSACNSETVLGDEQQFESVGTDLCAVERDNGSALVCEKIFAKETQQLPLTTVKSEPAMVTDFDLAAEQKPRICENQQAVDDELIAEVVANAYAFDGGISDGDSDSEAGFLKIRIENVCSIGAEGFESMNHVTYVKTESGVNVEESVAERTSAGVAVTVRDVSDAKSQCSLKTESADDDDFKETIAVINNVTSEVPADVGTTRCLVGNSEAAREIVSVAQPTCLDDNASSSQAVVKEQTCQEEEIVDVGDAEYSAAVGQQTTAKPSVVLKDRISDLVQGENFDDCDVEFDVLYENMSDENEDESEQNDSSKCKGSAESEISDEVLKFYSLGGDNYETAEVHSTLDLMSLNVKTAPTGSSTVGAETGIGKQAKKRKPNGSSGRKRRRKRRPLNLVKKSVKKKLPVENKDSELVLPQEVNNDVVSERVVESGKKKKKKSPVEESISPDSSETRPRKRFDRKQGQKSNVNAFLVSADAEKLCCALPEFGVGRTIGTEAKSTNSESADLHVKSLCSESHGPDLLEKEAADLEPAKLDEIQKTDAVHEMKLESESTKGTEEVCVKDSSKGAEEVCEKDSSKGAEEVCVKDSSKGAEEVCVKDSSKGAEEVCVKDSSKGAEEVCVKDSPSVEDLKQIESVADPSDPEKSEKEKVKKRKRRYGTSKRRKKKATLPKTCKTTRKYCRTTQKVAADVESADTSEQVNDFETDELQELPLYDDDKKCAEIPEAVLNLFSKGASPVELPSTSLRTSPRRKAAVLCQPPDAVKPNSRLRRISKLCRKRRTSSQAVDDLPESTLLDMLNDDKFLESLKSAVKAVEGSSAGTNSSEPAVKVGSPDELEASIAERNSVYFADAASTIQDCSENSKSSNVFVEHVHATNSENIDYLNSWKPSTEENLEVYSLASPTRTCSIPYSATDEAQTLQCSGLDGAVGSVSYSALLSAVNSAGSSISYDAIRNALMTVATSSKAIAPNPTQGTVAPHDHTAESPCPNFIARLNILRKDVSRESAESSLLESSRSADVTGAKESSTGACYSSPKVIIPLSVYLRNVRQSNCKTIKDTGCTNEPAFYTGVVKPSDCPAYFANQAANQMNHPNSQMINTRDPRLARMKPQQQQQQSNVPPLMQLEPQFPCNIPRTVLAHYTSIEETEPQNDVSFQSPVLTSPVQNRGCFPGYFPSFSNTENPIHASPVVVKKPVCSITPFIHQSEKAFSDDQQSKPITTEQDAVELPKDKPPWDGNWQLIPISNLPPRPPIIFARLPLTERKIDGFPFDPRIRSEKELCVRRQLSRPDHNVCDDVSLVIDGADVSAGMKSRRASSGALSNKNLVSKENTDRVNAVENLAKDWFSQGKPPSGVGDIAKRSPSEIPGTRESKSQPAPADEILSDLLSSLHTESFEGEIIKNMEAQMLCGLNKDRVLGNRSRVIIPKFGPSSEKQLPPKHRVDRPSPVLGDRDKRRRDRDHRSGDKRDKIVADVHRRDSRSQSRTSSSRGRDATDNSRGRRDDRHSARRDYQHRHHHRDSSRSHDDKSSQRSHVKPRLDVTSEGSTVSLVSTDPANKAIAKGPSEECLKKRQNSADEKAEGYDARKRLKKSPSPGSRARMDGRRDCSKSWHHSREVNSKLVNEGEKQVGKLERKMHDGKTRESAEEALRRKKMLRTHSSRVNNDIKSRQYDSQGHHRSGSREGRKSVDQTVNSNQKEAGKSPCHSQVTSGSKERLLHSQDKLKQSHRGEHVEKRRLSHADARERATIKDGDCSKTSHSITKVRPEVIQSPTTYSCLQQNLVSTDNVYIDVNEKVDREANDRTIHPGTSCTDEQLHSNAELLPGVCGAGILPTQDVNVIVTEADEEHHEGGSLVIHMEDANDEKDGESRLDCIMPPKSSCMTTDVHNDLKTSYTNEREKSCIVPVSLRSETSETSSSNEKRLADEVAGKDEAKLYKSSCYDGDSCVVAPKTNTQIRADILKSIRSLKLILEDKLKSDDVSDVSSESKTKENDSRTLSAEGSSENSFVLSAISSSDLVGNLGEEDEEKASVLGLSDGSIPTRENSSSDLSTKSDYYTRSSLASVCGTVVSSVSSEFVEASENAFVTAACAELKHGECEFFSNNYEARVDGSVPFLTPGASPGLPSEFPEVKEKDVSELSCAAQEYIVNTVEKSEMCTVEESGEENWINHGDQGNNVSNVSVGVLNEMQKAAVIKRETTDLTGIFDDSYLLDVEPSGDSGEDKGTDKTWETTEIYGGHIPLGTTSTSPENCEQSVLGINDGTDERCIYQDTEELFETKHESSHDESIEPSNSNGESRAIVNARKTCAADFFQDFYNAGNASDSIINVDSHDYPHQLEVRSHNAVKTEPDPFVEDLQTDEIPFLGDTFETGVPCKSEVESSSDVAAPSSSNNPLGLSRRARRHGKIADVWSNISSGWKELSRDYDMPADDDKTGVCVTLCTELPSSDVSTEALAAYKEVFKREVAMTEQRVVDSGVFTDPCEGLTECQIKKLLRINAANPEVQEELQLEYDIHDLDKDVGKIQECMEKIRVQLGQFRSPALDKTYDHVEQKFNFLLAKKEMYQYRLTTLRRYHKSHFVHLVPDEFLFDEEIGKYISLEGMLLFLHKPTISVQNCVRLTALKRETVQTREAMSKADVKQVEDVKRLIKLRWLHLQRKVLLQQLCCTTEKGQHRLIQYLAEKLAWYKGLQSEIESTGDEQAEDDVQSFVLETVNAFESYIATLQSMQKSAADGRWTLDRKKTFKKRHRSRSSVESRNHESDECAPAKKRRRRTKDVDFDDCDFEPRTSGRVGWRKGASASLYDQEDPGLSHRNSEFDVGRTRYEQGLERTDFEEDEGEEWLNSGYRYRGGETENVAWHEEGKRRWDCVETDDSYEQSGFTYTRPYHEDSSYGGHDWSGEDYSDRCARGYPQHH